MEGGSAKAAAAWHPFPDLMRFAMCFSASPKGPCAQIVGFWGKQYNVNGIWDLQPSGWVPGPSKFFFCKKR